MRSPCWKTGSRRGTRLTCSSLAAPRTARWNARVPSTHIQSGRAIGKPGIPSRRRVSGRSIRPASDGCVRHLEQLELLLGLLIMAEKVSTIDVRQRIGDMLNRVALRRDEFVIERKGKALAALVPIERLEQMRRFARRQALDFMEEQRHGSLTEREASDLALEAQRFAQTQVRNPRRGKK